MSNLLSILAAVTGRDPESLADEYDQYGPLKADVAEAVVGLLDPIQERFRELEADPGGTAEILAAGAEKASVVATAVVERAQRNVGLLAP